MEQSLDPQLLLHWKKNISITSCKYSSREDNTYCNRFVTILQMQILPASPLTERRWTLIMSRLSSYRGVAKLGIALGSGPRGPGFESRRSDH